MQNIYNVGDVIVVIQFTATISEVSSVPCNEVILNPTPKTPIHTPLSSVIFQLLNYKGMLKSTLDIGLGEEALARAMTHRYSGPLPSHY